jgi:hypothetical protein
MVAEREVESLSFSLQNKETELKLVVREKGLENIQVKIINEEVEEVKNKLKSVTSHILREQEKFKDLVVKRQQIQAKIDQDSELIEVQRDMLKLILSESTRVVEKMELESQYHKGEVRQKIKDAQIKKLKEQVMHRDELIDEARRILITHGFQGELVDPRIIHVNDLIFDHQQILKGISNPPSIPHMQDQGY